MKRKRAQRLVPVTPVSRNAPSWWLHGVVVLGLLLGTFGLYHRTLNLAFLPLDDPDYVQSNHYIERFSAQNLWQISTTPYFANYAPLHLLSYSVDVALAGGKSAAAMHLSNVLWYGWVVCMVYLLAFTLRTDIPTATGAAFLFLTHPAHVEVVTWISSRKDLIATGFAALSMTCYLRGRRWEGRHAQGWYAGSLLSFLLASAAKQSVALLPAVMLVWDLVVERRRRWGMVLDKIPFGLVTLFFAWQTLGAQPATGRVFDVLVPVTTQLRNLWLLTGLGDYVLYHPNVAPGAWNLALRIGATLVAILIWLAPLWWLRRGQRTSAALAYWVLISMVPPLVMNFTTPVADRYLFLPSVGFCILLAEVVARLADKFPAQRWAILAVLPALAVGWSMKTWNYLSEWRDPRSVWYGAKAKSNATQVFHYLGEAYQEAGDRINEFITSGKALDASNELALARAILNDPARAERLHAEWQGVASARTNSTAYRDLLWSLAWQEYEKAVVHRGTLSTPNLYLRRGKLLVGQGKAEQAIPELKQALDFARKHHYQRIREENVTHILRAIGIAYWNLRHYPEARKWYLEAQSVQKKSGQVWVATLDQEVARITQLAGGGN